MRFHQRYILQPSLLYNSTYGIFLEMRLTQWFASPYTKDSAPDQREAYLSSYKNYCFWVAFMPFLTYRFGKYFILQRMSEMCSQFSHLFEIFSKV